MLFNAMFYIMIKLDSCVLAVKMYKNKKMGKME